nr:S41 family peptidase [Anaerolineae bacterium]
MLETYQDARQSASLKTAFRIILFGAVGLALIAGGFLAGLITGTGISAHGGRIEFPVSPFDYTGAEGKTGGDVDMATFWEVWETVDDRFYHDLPSDEERVQGAINGMLDSLGDPYTAYVPPDVALRLSEDLSGEFEGIGAYVTEAPEGGVYIIRVFDESPAKEAGLQAGDIVIAVDGQDITDQILNESLLLIRGPAGTTVNLTIYREGELDFLELSIERARLEVPTVEVRMLEDNIGYVALFDFNAQSASRLEDAVSTLIDDGAESLILDLRNNPGGYLDESISIADLFLPGGTILIQRDVDGRERVFSSSRGDLAEEIPLVVLINGASASASEIVAAAIRDNERGILIGETSFGKGAVQLQYTLSDGSLLRVTYALWYTPSDISISENGIDPDITVESPEEISSDDDPQLDRAIDYLMTGQ